ncbi:helix-turn-helix domain-containing protein [Saccharothrix lopnurensis]|uniref:Helix-turn-helix domain-containing protein n=1 Tax=Saccharothrix lopnurensis TaxID=1670621 RepID=A0ABW1P5I2_9PSEU
MKNTKTQPATYALRLRDNAIDRQIVEHRLRYRSELCRRAGIQRSTLHRIERGTQDAGQRFIAGVLAALPDAKFEDLFEVVPAVQS